MNSANSKFTHLLFLTFALLAGFALSTQAAFANAPTCSASEYAGQTFRGMTVTSGFGTRNSGTTTNGNRMSSYHRALDLSVRNNPNVGAFHGGTVTHAGTMGGWGNTVVVTNGNFQVQYGHAGTMNVSVGQTVNPGEVLGNWSSCSGNCTGPHVDAIYQVNVNGQWHNIDPMIAEQMIASGMDPSSPEFAQQALAQTAARCSVNPNDLASRNAATRGKINETGLMCADDIRANVMEQLQAGLAARQNFVNTYMTPPPQVSQVANTPCMSQELQRINRQFGGMVNSGITGIGNAVGLGGGTISNIMNNAFKGDVNTFNSAASILPGMLNFQSIASNVLGGLLQNLGLGGSGFSSQVCGIMLDMVLKYIQCENPIKFPNLSNLFGKLNLNLPNSCAGQAARDGLLNLSKGTALRPLAQSIRLSN